MTAQNQAPDQTPHGGGAGTDSAGEGTGAGETAASEAEETEVEHEPHTEHEPTAHNNTQQPRTLEWELKEAGEVTNSSDTNSDNSRQQDENGSRHTKRKLRSEERDGEPGGANQKQARLENTKYDEHNPDCTETYNKDTSQATPKESGCPDTMKETPGGVKTRSYKRNKANRSASLTRVPWGTSEHWIRGRNRRRGSDGCLREKDVVRLQKEMPRDINAYIDSAVSMVNGSAKRRELSDEEYMISAGSGEEDEGGEYHDTRSSWSGISGDEEADVDTEDHDMRINEIPTTGPRSYTTSTSSDATTSVRGKCPRDTEQNKLQPEESRVLGVMRTEMMQMMEDAFKQHLKQQSDAVNEDRLADVIKAGIKACMREELNDVRHLPGKFTDLQNLVIENQNKADEHRKAVEEHQKKMDGDIAELRDGREEDERKSAKRHADLMEEITKLKKRCAKTETRAIEQQKEIGGLRKDISKKVVSVTKEIRSTTNPQATPTHTVLRTTPQRYGKENRDLPRQLVVRGVRMPAPNKNKNLRRTDDKRELVCIIERLVRGVIDLELSKGSLAKSILSVIRMSPPETEYPAMKITMATEMDVNNLESAYLPEYHYFAEAQRDYNIRKREAEDNGEELSEDERPEVIWIERPRTDEENHDINRLRDYTAAANELKLEEEPFFVADIRNLRVFQKGKTRKESDKRITELHKDIIKRLVRKKTAGMKDKGKSGRQWDTDLSAEEAQSDEGEDNRKEDDAVVSHE